MYCPRCGQQQISDEMRFCSRCGLPMSGLAEWLAGGGVPVARAQEPQMLMRSPRQKGIRRGAKLMFLSGVLVPVFLVISLAIDEGAPMIIPLIVFFVALTTMLYYRLFGDENQPISDQQAQEYALRATAAASALPPATVPLYGPPQPSRTNELAQPSSVTENTTRLLDEE